MTDPSTATDRPGTVSAVTMTPPMLAGPEGGFNRRIDAIIFGDDGTVTVEFDTPNQDAHPGVLRGSRRTVAFDLSEGVTDAYTGIHQSACDLVGAILEAERQPATRIPGGAP